MAEKLRALGFTIDPARLQHESPGRPHLAAALLEDNDLTPDQERGLRPVPRPRHADLRRAFAAHGQAGDRGHPRRRRARRLGAPVLGRRAGRGRAARVRRRRPRRRRGVLHHPHGGADPASTRARARAGPDHDRLNRLSRAGARSLQSLSRLPPVRELDPRPSVGPPSMRSAAVGSTTDAAASRQEDARAVQGPQSDHGSRNRHRRQEGEAGSEQGAARRVPRGRLHRLRRSARDHGLLWARSRALGHLAHAVHRRGLHRRPDARGDRRIRAADRQHGPRPARAHAGQDQGQGPDRQLHLGARRQPARRAVRRLLPRRSSPAC